MKRFLPVLFVCVIILGPLGVRDTASQETTSPPNIVMIVTHDLGQHVGAYGVDEVHTPEIDGLAERGVRFKNMYSTSGVCTPGRASLHTGRYPQSNGLMGLSHSPWWWSLNDDERHTAQHFRSAGYETYLIGLSHLGESPGRLGYDKKLAGQYKAPSALEPLLHDDETNSSPFFAKVGFQETHRPFDRGTDREHGLYVPPFLKPTETMKKDLARFQADVRFLDKQVGRIIEAIEESPESDNTLILFTSEHGIPYPGAKWTCRRAGLEVPLIAYQPDSPFSGGTVFNQLISNVDVLPTLLDYIGQSIPDRIQGTSFMPVIRGDQTDGPRRYAFGQYTRDMKRDNESRTVLTKKYQLIWYHSQGRSVAYPVRVHPKLFGKHIRRARTRGTRPYFQLYDLSSDPGQLNNIADEHPEVVDRLKSKLLDWMQQVNDPLLKEEAAWKAYSRKALRALRK